MIRIIADDKIPFLKGILEPYAQISYLPGANTGNQEIKNADALITRTRTKCNASNLKGSNVKMIATATIGFDHIDTDFCKKNGIEWTNAPGCNSGSVKQFIASALAILATQKEITLKNKTIGIVGVGNVGSKIKDLAEALGMKVLLNDPPRALKEGSDCFVDIDKIQAEADIITFHVPLQRESIFKTFHMGNQSFFAKCKKSPVIINSSRGEVINNQDLSEALDKQIVGEVILDVWENEPAVDLELMKKTLIATPHIAGYSVDGKANGTSMSVQAISKHFNLPLTEWYPTNLPPADNPEIFIQADKMNDQEIYTEAILHTYNILNDDEKLRKSPDSFEIQRGNYPPRREFSAYKVILKNGSDFLKKNLNKIGFTNVELI